MATIANPVDRSASVSRSGILAEKGSKALTQVVLLLGVALFLMPLYVMVAMALKDQSEVATTSIWAWPRQPTLTNFKEVLSNPNVSFALFLKNTTIIAVTSTIGVVMTSAMAAFAFARIEFAGRDRLFVVLLATMMLPGIVTMIPTYVMYAQIGWVNTFKPLIVPAFFGGGAFNIFLLRQFYMGIPRELDEAAFLDGAGHWTVFWRVLMPLAKPALVTVGVLSFMGAWRDFMGPLLYLNEASNQTLEVGLRTYTALQAEKWHLLMAGSVLVMIPIIIVFFIGQRSFVKGIVMTGGK
ncbi:MAG: carbohydrate ABC transporter permease [Chlorobia bacterium]|nr:carbohydrate ABC transporter permease [Fimbriimonadaceae bacterium]